MKKVDILLLGFQDSATPIMEGIIDLHNYIFFYLTLVLIFVLSFLVNIVYCSGVKSNDLTDVQKLFAHRTSMFESLSIRHDIPLEVIWTLIPSFILISIAVPSLALLYSMDEVVMPGLVVKVIGHQWYWSYEYSNTAVEFELDYYKYQIGVEGPSFDSYMIVEDELKHGHLRLLEVDRQLVLPSQTHIRLLVTSSDVLHSWAVPSLGIKIDAVPGRLSQVNLFLKRQGTFYGQCSEICGVNHGFMPIAVKSVSLTEFLGVVQPTKSFL